MELSAIISKLDRLDKMIYENILVYADPQWLRDISLFLVKDSHIIPPLILFFLIYGYKNPRAAVLLFFSTLLLLGISEPVSSTLKSIFQRPRPINQMGIYIASGIYSLPSAHSLNTMAFAVFWSSRFKSAAPYLFSFSIIIGTARMLSNFHFPGDIIAGWFFGFIVGTSFVLVYNHIEKKFPNIFMKQVST